MSIRLLPQTLINQIAAGEVLERPASAVKELVENAIDAGATDISIQIRDGGKSSLTVIDNGKGLSKKDLEMAVERHATSKLPDGDLFNINTLGFRGEALPSIGAVARLRLTSRAQGSDEGWSLLVDGGEKHAPEPTSCAQGTKVEVNDLFFATPARLKFLKATTTEVSHIRDVLNRIAMSCPQIAFTLTDEKRTLFHYPVASTLLERLEKIMGKDFKDNAVEVDYERDAIRLRGYGGLPTLNRANASLQYLFVNNRPVRDKLLNGALRAAYQDFLARDRHPLVVLYVDLPNNEVDMNVHPAKTEVRFKEAGTVRGLIVGALKEALNRAGHRASTTVAQAAMEALKPSSGTVLRESQSGFTPSQPSMLSGAPKPPVSYGAGTPAATSLGLQKSPQSSYAYSSVTPREGGNGSPETQPQAYAEASTEASPSHDPNHVLGDYPLGEAQAQVHETYVIAESKDGIVIVDQHAAHERLVYEKMKADMATKGLQRQILLVPEFVELTESQMEAVMGYKEDLLSIGLSVEKMGETSLLVREVPALLGHFNVSQLIKDLVDEIEELGSPLSLKEKMDEILGTMACHGSIRSGKRMSIEEMNALLREMEKTPHSGQCNHGRPTYVELSKVEVEKLFGRR